ncbi:MAG: MBL fold metallo-hydrolase [Anaerolineae bacterium]|jgi:glyoxylase-like metal-dependent hydrolase (beta-lactamase superfamily II)
MQEQNVQTITLAMPLKLGTVNCYLVETGGGFVLIDTGGANRRAELDSALTRAGCRPGDLKLVVLTHGDFDHTGNAAYLRDKFGARIAMHRDDAGMAEQGDMFWNRSSGNAIIRLLAPILFRFSRSNRFRPDLTLEEGDDLSEYGFDARVLSLPGHSRGSLGTLTAGGDFFCGDLLENTKEPAINAIMDDSAACEASLEKLRGFEIDTVYPGHGQPFTMDAFLAARRQK